MRVSMSTDIFSSCVPEKGAVFGKDQQGFRQVQAMRGGAATEHGFQGGCLSAGKVLARADNAGFRIATTRSGDNIGDAGGDARQILH